MPRPLHNTMMRGSYENEDLLEEGRYREWFWSGFDTSQVAYLKSPVQVPTPPTPEPIYQKKEFPQVKRWRDDAACAGVDSVVFFGEEGDDIKQLYLAPESPWRKLCPDCPVKDLCLELAEKSQSMGIFGGKYFTYNSGWAGPTIGYTEENMPKPGRPKSTSPRSVKRRAETARKKANARVSTT